MEMTKRNLLMKLKYQVVKNQNGKLRLFSQIFVKKNKSKYKMVYKNRIYEIKEFLDDIDSKYRNKNFISIKLIILNNTISLSYMFKECSSLISITNLS